MKRSYETIVVFIVAISLLATYGCGGGASASSASTGTSTGITGATVTPSPLQGTWLFQSSILVGNPVFPASKTNETLIFAANGDWTLNVPVGAWFGGGPSADCLLTGTSIASATQISQTATTNTCNNSWTGDFPAIETCPYTISGTTLTISTPNSTDTWAKQ